MSEHCLATTKSGDPCKGKPLENGYCFAHQDKEPVEETIAKESGSELCGHVNLHSYDTEGEQDFLKCTLPKGHEGRHKAMHYEIKWHKGGIAEEGDVEVTWTDMAGTPVEEVEPDLYTLPKHNPRHPNHPINQTR